MNINNIFALVGNDLRIIKSVSWRILDITYFPLTTTLIWGLFTLHSRQYALEAGLIVLISNLFWTFSQLAQQEANILIMEDLWSLSIKQILISGISESEYLLAKLITSTATAVIMSFILIIIADAFGAPLLMNLKIILVLAGIALLGSLALAVFIAGTIICLGREYGFLSWSLLQLFVFFSAPFYSPTLFPKPLQWLTTIMPFTNIFQAARALATHAPITNTLLIHALIVTLTYFFLAWPYYFWCFRRARKTGMLARITH